MMIPAGLRLEGEKAKTNRSISPTADRSARVTKTWEKKTLETRIRPERAFFYARPHSPRLARNEACATLARSRKRRT